MRNDLVELAEARTDLAQVAVDQPHVAEFQGVLHAAGLTDGVVREVDTGELGDLALIALIVYAAMFA